MTLMQYLKEQMPLVDHAIREERIAQMTEMRPDLSPAEVAALVDK